jgi:hypothetical protein
MVGVDQVDPNLVRADGESSDVDRVDVAGVRPPPRQVVDMDMQMSGAGRHVQGALSEDRYDADVLDAPLNPDDPFSQSFLKRGVDEELRCRLVFGFDLRRGSPHLLRARRGGLGFGACRRLGPSGGNAGHHCNCKGQESDPRHVVFPFNRVRLFNAWDHPIESDIEMPLPQGRGIPPREGCSIPPEAEGAADRRRGYGNARCPHPASRVSG